MLQNTKVSNSEDHDKSCIKVRRPFAWHVLGNRLSVGAFKWKGDIMTRVVTGLWTIWTVFSVFFPFQQARFEWWGTNDMRNVLQFKNILDGKLCAVFCHWDILDCRCPLSWCSFSSMRSSHTVDDYAKNGEPGEVWLVCSFYHESLPTWIKTIVNKFATSNHTAFILGVHALRSYLKLSCEYELYILPNKIVSPAKDHDKKLHQGQTAPGPPSFA